MMKGFLRSFLIYAIALWAANQLFSGVSFTKGYETLAVTAVVLGLANLLIKPLLNILLLPINLLTLGTFRWIVNVGILFIVTMVVPDFQITSFLFPGFSYQGMTFPAIFLGAIPAFIVVSFFLSFASGFLFWLAK